MVHLVLTNLLNLAMFEQIPTIRTALLECETPNRADGAQTERHKSGLELPDPQQTVSLPKTFGSGLADEHPDKSADS